VLVTKLEVIWNGQIAAQPDLNAASADVTGRITPKRGGWMLVRAWREEGDEDVLDIHRYATTSPVYVTMGGRPPPIARSGDVGAGMAGPAREGDPRKPGLSDARGARGGAARRLARQGLLPILLRRRRGIRGERAPTTVAMVFIGVDDPRVSEQLKEHLRIRASRSVHRGGTFEATTPQPGPFP